MNEELKKEIKDKLNEIAILLKDVSHPDVENNEEGSFSTLEYFADDTKIEQCVKVVIEGLLTSLDDKNRRLSDASKMARAYYTSFCNG